LSLCPITSSTSQSLKGSPGFKTLTWREATLNYPHFPEVFPQL
jgi:hypothetical protein